MTHDRQLVVVEACPFQARVVQRETERPYQVQARTGVGAQSDDVAGIAGNFRLEQDDMDHARIVLHSLSTDAGLAR